MFHNLSDVIYFFFISQTLTVDFANICQFEVKRKTKAVCVRAKDAFCNSPWSEWTHFGSVHTSGLKWEIQPLFSNKNRTNCVYLFTMCLIASVIQRSFLPGLFCFLIFTKARSQNRLTGCRQGCKFWIVFVWTYKYCCNIIVRDFSC